MKQSLCMYVVYQNPSDYPGKWIVRRLAASAGCLVADPCIWAAGETYEEVLAHIPDGLAVLPREPGDHPAVVETWM